MQGDHLIVPFREACRAFTGTNAQTAKDRRKASLEFIAKVESAVCLGEDEGRGNDESNASLLNPFILLLDSDSQVE